jgi:hypothetical protein
MPPGVSGGSDEILGWDDVRAESHPRWTAPLAGELRIV